MTGTVTKLGTTGAATGLVSLLLPPRLFGRRRHKTTRAGLRNLALAESEALTDLVDEREARRPRADAVVEDHEHPHRCVTLHDEGTQSIYTGDHLPVVEDLREQFAGWGVRDEALDGVYEAPRNGADLRTVSTALLVMAGRLR